MQFVLDNSVTMRWLFGDGSKRDLHYSQAVLTGLQEDSAIVPGLWYLEVANVLTRAEIKYGLSEARSTEFLRLLNDLNIETDPASTEHIYADVLQLARRYSLTAYDATYLELALRSSLPLATLDEGLLKASKKAGIQRYL